MENAGKAIYMACFALIFVVAASISIYLYGTLDEYLDRATEGTQVTNRTEGVANEDLLNFKRNISVSEIYITLYNMTQMHVTELKVNGKKITQEQYNEDPNRATNTKLDDVLDELEGLSNSKFTYSYSGSTVTYTPISSGS